MIHRKQAMVSVLICIFLLSVIVWWFWYETPRCEMMRRIDAGIRYLNMLWAEYAFYETLDNRASDYQTVCNDTNYLVARILNRIGKEAGKAAKVMEWLAGYEEPRWKLLFEEEPSEPEILMEYSNSSYADHRALSGIYYVERNVSLARHQLNWIKERFNGQGIRDRVWEEKNESEGFPAKPA